MFQTVKYVFTVEGETEKWYLEWLREQINSCSYRTCNFSAKIAVQQSPLKFCRSILKQSMPEVIHVCDVEGNEQDQVKKFEQVLSEMKQARGLKRMNYILGYSNFAFELWIILHKRECNGSLSHRTNYLDLLRNSFNERFESLNQYKQEAMFKRCLNKINLEDVKSAIQRADKIMDINEKSEKTLIEYKGYSYYRDNPALSIHMIIKKILIQCGLIKGGSP